MPIQINESMEKAELQFRLDNLAAIERDNERKRRHEENLLRLKVELADKRKKTVSRTEALQRTLVAVIKLPTLIILMPFLGALAIKGREVPAYLQDYINL